jgi:hypothetical protein
VGVPVPINRTLTDLVCLTGGRTRAPLPEGRCSMK